MKLLATKKVLEGSHINVLHKMKDTWFLMTKKELTEDFKFDEDNVFIIDESYLFDRIPTLKGKLDHPNETTININYKTGEINFNKKHFHLGIPTHGAKSNRQANAGFSFFHYITTFRSAYFKTALLLLLLLILALKIGWFFYIPLALYAAYKTLETLKTRDMYYSGALCPSIVIDAENKKIAAYTDLSLGFGTYPIIRIRKTELPKKYLKNGEKIPVAGAYQKTEDYNHWNFYEPHPLPSGIRSDAVIEDKKDQIPIIEWVKLKNEIKKFDGIPKEGYYPIDIDSSSWKEMELDQIKWMQFGEEK